MLKLVWTIATLTAQGPLLSDVPETTTFQTVQECREFGTTMTPRLEDWVRGLVRADWEDPVAVKFRCESGQGA